MKTVLIAASVAVFLVYGFVMYCCMLYQSRCRIGERL